MNMALGLTCEVCGGEPEIKGTRYGVRKTCLMCGRYAWGDYKLVTKETHMLRQECHEIFDAVWKGTRRKQKNRSAMYEWLAYRLEKTSAETHFKLFEVDDLKRALGVLEGITLERIHNELQARSVKDKD